jgi:hypothetical protein
MTLYYLMIIFWFSLVVTILGKMSVVSLVEPHVQFIYLKIFI